MLTTKEYLIIAVCSIIFSFVMTYNRHSEDEANPSCVPNTECICK